jgi:hypothetical protein
MGHVLKGVLPPDTSLAVERRACASSAPLFKSPRNAEACLVAGVTRERRGAATSRAQRGNRSGSGRWKPPRIRTVPCAAWTGFAGAPLAELVFDLVRLRRFRPGEPGVPDESASLEIPCPRTRNSFNTDRSSGNRQVRERAAPRATFANNAEKRGIHGRIPFSRRGFSRTGETCLREVRQKRALAHTRPLLPDSSMCETILTVNHRERRFRRRHALVWRPPEPIFRVVAPNGPGAINSAARVLPLQGRSRGFESLIAQILMRKTRRNAGFFVFSDE